MINHFDIKVRKNNGEIVDFSLKKLKNSLKHSGADNNSIEQIVNYVSRNVYDNITSDEIYKLAYEKLRDIRSVFASRYKIKKAINELGPSGFPFERFIATLIEKKTRNKTEIGVFVKGACVEHELDIIVEKKNSYFFVECKFHSGDKYISNIKTPLYINSRFKDVKKNWPYKKPLKEVWIATNTRFSEDAIHYAKCNHIKLLSWNYPKGNGLKEWIDELGVYPLTSLTLLSEDEKNRLLENDIVLCSELAENNNLINKIGISKNRKNRILDEISQLCNHKIKLDEQD